MKFEFSLISSIIWIFIESQILNSDLELSDEQQKRLEISRKEISDGKLYSNDEVDKEVKDWLEK